MLIYYQDQIQKPTYMGEESMEGESISTLINKGSRRKSFAAIGTMVAKLKKRRQSARNEEKGKTYRQRWSK